MASAKNFVVFLVAMLATCPCVFTAAQSFDRTDFSSDLASVVDSHFQAGDDWDYSDGPNGPAHWGMVCQTGVIQSPIDIVEDWIKLDGYVDIPANFSYRPAPAFIYGDGKILEVQWEAGVFVHNDEYLLEKLTFHTPSEHTYFTKRFPLEIQFYHNNPEVGAAISVLVFEEGEHNEWLQQFLSSLPTKVNLGETVAVGVVHANGVGNGDLDWTRYYRYVGSLSTPPCSETPGVYWSLLKSPLSASRDQIQQIEAALLNKPNVRPIPEMAQRIIYYPRFADGGN